MSESITALVLTPLLVAALVQLARIDLGHRRLPDVLTLPILMVGLILSAWRAQGVPVPELLGAAGGFLLFWGLGEAHFRLRGTEGLGLGDAKLLAAAGAWLGWRDLPLLILLAASGALAAVALGHIRHREVAFGPWLAVAFLLMWLGRLVREGAW